MPNIFESGQQVVTDQDTGKSGFSRFLKSDQPGAIYKKIFKVHGRTITFYADGKAHGIHGIEGSPYIYAAVIEQATDRGTPVKRLYGWHQEKDWGHMGLYSIDYMVSKRYKPGWRILDKPVSSDTMNQRQEILAETAKMVRFLLHDQGARTYERIMRVLVAKGRGRICYGHQGSQYTIYGLDNIDWVKVSLREEYNPEAGRLENIATLYEVRDLKVSSAPWGHYRLGHKENDRWIIYQPEVLVSVSRTQNNRVQARNLADFMLNDRPEQEYIKPAWQLYGHGELRLHFNATIYTITGLARFKHYRTLCGVIRQVGDQKIVYLWPGKKSYDAGEPPLEPAGIVVGQRIGSGWEMILTSQKHN